MSEYKSILERLSIIERKVNQIQQDTGKVHRSMSQSTRVVSQIDDDFLRRLVDAIEEACTHYDGTPMDDFVEETIDGDLFLAYQEVKQMFKESYPDWYPEDDE